MKRLLAYAKYIPLLLVGVAVIVWGMLFHRDSAKQQKNADDSIKPSDQTMFPY